MMPTRSFDHVRAIRVTAIVLLLAAIALAHWLTPRADDLFHGMHVVMRKMFILPIVLAAVWFNLRGAIITTTVATAVYLPHVFLQWGGDAPESLNQIGEVLTMWGVALLGGWFVAREKLVLRAVTRSHQGALAALVAALDAREHDTELHSLRVQAYALRIGQQMGLPPGQLKVLGRAALLHDIGKIGVPDDILLKPGPLDEQQWHRMRTHPEIGRYILQQVPFLKRVADIVYAHHEKYDGTGYPQHLHGEQIPLLARVFAVADAFDALTSKRCYRRTLNFDAARELIEHESDGHFDPRVVKAFGQISTTQWQSILANLNQRDHAARPRRDEQPTNITEHNSDDVRRGVAITDRASGTRGESQASRKSAFHSGPKSIRFQLLLAINVVVGLGMIAMLIVDYRTELADRFENKLVSLQEEAYTLLPAVEVMWHHGIDAVQDHIDTVCARMQEATSPGHHIAVKSGETTLQARTHHRASPQMLAAMERADRSRGQRGHLQDQELIVGSATKDELSVYVSEYVTDVRQSERRRLLWRSMGLLLLGLVGAGALNVILVRIVTQPLGRLVATVRRIGRGELGIQASSFNTAELTFLAREVNAMSSSLAAADRRHRWEMQKAQRIQRHLHPSNLPSGRLSVAYRYEPASKVGGDYLDVKQLPNNIILLCMADVTGHGVPAAMGAAVIKTLFDTAADRWTDPSQILKAVGEGFKSASLDEDFATMAVVAVDIDHARIRYANAGHEPGYLIGVNGNIEQLEATGPLLGVEQLEGWQTLEHRLLPGDRIVLVTDGLAETLNENDVQMGRSGLVQLLKDERQAALNVMCDRIIQRTKMYQGPGDQSDDWTLLIASFEDDVAH